MIFVDELARAFAAFFDGLGVQIGFSVTMMQDGGVIMPRVFSSVENEHACNS